MQQTDTLKPLRITLTVLGAVFIVGVYPMMMWIFPSGWGWLPRQPQDEQMIMVLYAVLGVFLIRAARDPRANASLIWFTIWSSIAHGGLMLVQALLDRREHMHLLGDVPALFAVAAVLWYLMPSTQESAAA